MKGLVVADAAKADLRDIATYTEETWGAGQKQRYLDELQQRFQQLRQRPSLGRRRSEIGEGYRSVRCRRHVIFYRETTGEVVILRVLHERMDVRRHLGQPS
jgi:toxin ParE1/3/4